MSLGDWYERGQVASWTELFALICKHTGPVKQMWSHFWLKLAAVKVTDEWSLYYFTIHGRFSSQSPYGAHGSGREINREIDDIFLFSGSVAADELWQILHDLQVKGLSTIAGHSVRLASNGPVTLGSRYYEQRCPVHDVEAESTAWRYMRLEPQSYDRSASEKMNQIVSPTLRKHQRLDLQDLVRDWLKVSFPLPRETSLSGLFDFPMGVRASASVDGEVVLVSLDVRAPLNQAKPCVRYGDSYADSMEVEVSDVVGQPQDPNRGVQGGSWSLLECKLPLAARGTGLWLEWPAVLANPLPWNIPDCRDWDNVKDVLGAMYTKDANPERGKEVWLRVLLRSDPDEGKGERFEVALSNAFSRLGFAVLFGGSGLETPGYDLAIVDSRSRRIALVSAKSNAGLPSRGDRESLKRQITRVEALTGWTVRGVFVIKMLQVADTSEQVDQKIGVWGTTELKALAKACTPGEVDTMLFPHRDVGSLDDVFSG